MTFSLQNWFCVSKYDWPSCNLSYKMCKYVLIFYVKSIHLYSVGKSRTVIYWFDSNVSGKESGSENCDN